MERELSQSTQANRDLGLGALDLNILRRQVERKVLGVDRPIAFARYEVVRRLGSGGMGVVYLAHDPELDRSVAIKHLHPQLDSADAEAARRRLQREARAMARLTHPNVVSVYEFGVDQDQIFIAMEYVEGVTLREWLDAGPRSSEAILATFLAAGDGLGAAHAAGLVHRDFKPQNVLLSGTGAVKVSDFGLASVHAHREPTGPERTEPGAHAAASAAMTAGALGTPIYMAPEVHAGAPADARSDQFSFCVALYEGLFGQRPFPGADVAELRAAVVAGRRAPRPRRSKIPEWILAALDRGLSLAPDDRWPSMHALLGALRDDPRARRRRRFSLAALALAGVGAALLALARSQIRAQRVATCEAEGRQIEAVWNPEIRTRLEAELDEPDALQVRDAALGVFEGLDDYAQRWADARRDLCLAREVEGRLAPELGPRGVRCLDARRSRLEVIVDELTELDAPATLRVRAELLTLPEVSPCLAPAHLRDLPELPASLAEGQRELSRALARVALLRELHRFAEAEALAEHTHADAEQLGWPPSIARAKLELGLAVRFAPDSRDAPALLEDAFFLAIEHDVHATAATAASWLAEFALEGDADDASRWLRHAEAALANLERPGAELLERVEQSRLAVAMHGNHFDTAIATGERLLVSLEHRVGPEHPTLLVATENLGQAYLAGQRPDAAIAMFERSLVLRQRWFAASGLLRVKILMGLATAQEQLGDLARAREHYEEALALREATPGAPMLVAHLVEILAGLSEREGDLERARDGYARAVAINEQSAGRGSPPFAARLEALARVERALGQREQALEHFDEVLAIRLRTTDFHLAEAALELRREALAQREAGRLDESLDLYAVALERHAEFVATTGRHAPRHRYPGRRLRRPPP